MSGPAPANPRHFPCDRMAGSNPLALVSTGLVAGEVVVRGGFLKEPAVWTGLTVVNGRLFKRLTKGAKDLHWFLTGKPAFKRFSHARATMQRAPQKVAFRKSGWDPG